jgi:hypothetical protein
MIQGFLLTAVLLTIIMTSCGSHGMNTAQKSDPDFIGFVTNVEKGGSGEVVGRINVESHADKLVHRHTVNVTRGTVILRREGEQDRPTNIESIKPKDWLKLWFREARGDRFPDEVTATKVLIVDRP